MESGEGWREEGDPVNQSFKVGGSEIGDQKSIKLEMEMSKKVQRRRHWRDGAAIQRTRMSIRGGSQPGTWVLGAHLLASMNTENTWCTEYVKAKHHHT